MKSNKGSADLVSTPYLNFWYLLKALKLLYYGSIAASFVFVLSLLYDEMARFGEEDVPVDVGQVDPVEPLEDQDNASVHATTFFLGFGCMWVWRFI